MCGIYASQVPFLPGTLLQLAHRGPDEQRSMRTGGMTIGSTRLAIVDTETPDARQPHTTRRRNIVAFNGEIYNYRKLWREAPSEVALIGEMIDEGIDVRQFFDGDYAIMHFNPSTGKLILYRDRFGVCPLYFEVRPWVQVCSEARRIYPFGREVPAHGRIEIDTRKRKITKRSVLPLYGATSESVSFRALCEEIMEAVKSRATHTESSFSLALSGGLDSTVIALALRELELPPAMSLTTFFDASSEDLSCASAVAEALHLPHTTIPIRPRDIPTDRILEHLDCPAEKVTDLRWQGALRSWFVAEESPTKVILCGDGVDELIGGYSIHRRSASREYRVSAKRLSTLRSMQHFNLDRTNKMGMAHSKEFRAPFLASSLSQMLLSSRFEHPKMLLRRVINYWGGPQEVAMRTNKYSPDELAVTR